MQPLKAQVLFTSALRGKGFRGYKGASIQQAWFGLVSATS